MRCATKVLVTNDVQASAALDASSTVSVYCTVGTAYSLALNVGSGGGTYTGRKMLSGSNELEYNLYTYAARTTVWADARARAR